jgi:hypothetical protein
VKKSKVESYLGLPIINDRDYGRIRSKIEKNYRIISYLGRIIIKNSSSLEKIINTNIAFYEEITKDSDIDFFDSFTGGLRDGYQVIFGLFDIIAKTTSGMEENLFKQAQIDEATLNSNTVQRVTDFVSGRCIVDNGRYRYYPDINDSDDVCELDAMEYFERSDKVYELISDLEEQRFLNYADFSAPFQAIKMGQFGFSRGIINGIQTFIQLREEQLISSVENSD